MRRRGFLWAAFVVAILGLGVPAATDAYRDALGPLDLGAARDGSTVVLDRSGRLLRAFTMPDGRWRLPLAARDVDPRFLAMLVAYEDRRFAAHGGVDVRALVRAAVQFVAQRHVVSGGSTLTMQVARLVEPRARRSPAAKLRQIARAVQIERAMSKRDILDLYVSLAPYGGNIEGVRAASLAYFGKEPKRLSTAQAALLVALPQAAEARRPDRFPAAARAARDRVLDRAFERGVITAAERAAAKAEDVPHVRRPFPALAPHASEEARRDMPAARTLRLTLDARLQEAVEALAHDAAARLGPKLSAAVLVVDTATGAIRAHVGSADYFAAARAGSIDMTQALRSPGSALKPFIYAMAFDSGLAHPETILDDRPSRFGAYAPENFDLSYQGAVTARRALQQSLNVPAVELLAAVGPTRFVAHLRSAGAAIALPPDAPPSLAVALGGLGITLTDLARLYAGLAHGGRIPELHERLDGRAVAPPGLRRLVGPVASWYVADILRGAPPPPDAPAGRIAFKTGTSYGYRDAFAVGFDRTSTIAVWVGRPDNGAVPGLVGRLAAAPLLFDVFARLNREPDYAAAPRDALIARTAALPAPLRRLQHDLPHPRASANPPLRIAFPPDGARIDLGFAQGAPDTALALKAQGGVPPFTWMVDGAPVAAPDLRRQSLWRPAGAGFARISVMDAAGVSDSVVVRLD